MTFLAFCFLFSSLSSLASSQPLPLRKHRHLNEVQPQVDVANNNPSAVTPEQQKENFEPEKYLKRRNNYYRATPPDQGGALYQQDSLDLTAGGNSQQNGLESEFLDAHNKLRVAVGEEPLVWDQNLTTYALKHSWGCRLDCVAVHSDGPYGENMFWGAGTDYKPSEVVQSWIDEKDDYDPHNFGCTLGRKCGHYTQMVWKSTKRVGCGMVECVKGGTIATCSYDPPGNYIGENPFDS